MAALVEVEEPTERIEAEVCTLAGQIAAATCRFILLIAELDRRESWKEWGCASMAHWLSWKCALGIGTAREHVRVGRSRGGGTFLAGRNDRPPTETVVHVDADELSPGEITPYVERLLCDTSVRVDVKQGGVHHVGKRKQHIPRWLRRRLAKRDRGMCRFPGCANSLYKQVHHLWHEAHGGPTDTENCLLLCSFHHHLVHEGGWHAFGNADEVVTFVSPRGKRFTDVPAETSPATFRRSTAPTNTPSKLRRENASTPCSRPTSCTRSSASGDPTTDSP